MKEGHRWCQLVSIHGRLHVDFGATQRLVLEPTLFLVMINDLDDLRTTLKFLKDMSLLSTGTNVGTGFAYICLMF